MLDLTTKFDKFLNMPLQIMKKLDSAPILNAKSTE